MTIALCVVDPVAGAIQVLHDASPTVNGYEGGMSLVSYNQGASWGLDGSKETIFRTYGVPEPITICLLGLGGLAVLRKRRR